MENKIDGGPACDYRLEHPKEKCFKGRRWRWALLQMPREWEGLEKEEWQDRGECPKCHGTGVKPLREWTADECADFIWDNGCEWDEARMPNPDLGYDLWFITVYDRETAGAEFAKQVKEREYTEALRAAVAAVAKERK